VWTSPALTRYNAESRGTATGGVAAIHFHYLATFPLVAQTAGIGNEGILDLNDDHWRADAWMTFVDQGCRKLCRKYR